MAGFATITAPGVPAESRSINDTPVRATVFRGGLVITNVNVDTPFSIIGFGA